MVRKLLKRAGVCLLSLSMVLTGNVGISGASTSSRKGAAVETKTGSIVIDGNDIKADNVNGLTYKGFGMLSANSTSDLLMDYKSQNPEAYAKLMQYLFGGEYPIFTHVKLEMGNDRNNSTGSESATKRTKGEKANVLRNPGWQLAADAKKINPNLKVSILTWRTPSWVKTDEDKYIWYKQSILDAYEKYGYKFLVFAGNGHDETEHRYIQELMSYKIEGLIVLSHTLSSRELSDLQIPVVAIEREDQFVSSVNTDNYLGAYEATSLLIHNHCDVLIHLNSPTKENIPAYRRLAGFQDACVKAGVPHKVIIRDFGLSYQEAAAPLQEIFDNIEQKYAGQKKGIFLSNDDHANILLNLLIRKYHTLPDDYELIGFDGAPISEQAIYPISTVGQQIDQIADEAVSLLVSQMQERKKRHPVPLAEPVHKTVPPLLIRRQTTT